MDGHAQRAQLVGQAVLLGAAWALQAWPLVMATAAILALGALRWPSAALFVHLHQRFVAPRLAAVPPIDGRPPRFSAALGAASLAGIGGLIAAGAESLGWALVLVNVAAVSAEAVIGRCAPCELFVWAARRNLVRLATPLAVRVPTGSAGAVPAGLVLVSAPYCHACRRLRAAIDALAPGLPYTEVDVMERPDVVRALDIRSTPTLLALDGARGEHGRLQGDWTTDELRRILAFNRAP